MPSIRATFVIAQLLELALPALFEERAVVLPNKYHKVLRKPVWHLDGVHDTARCFVISAEIIDLARELPSK